MDFKKFLSLLCTVTMLFSSTFCCKAEDKCNVVFLGDEKTGKTQICNRLFGKKFNEKYMSTSGADFTRLELNDNIYSMWDTSGRACFKGVAISYSRNAKLGIIVCNLSDQKTIESFGGWIQSYTERSDSKNIILVGNKLDSIKKDELETKKQTLIELARQHDIPEPEKRVVLVSAKNGDGIEVLKNLIIEHTPELKQDIPEPISIHDNSTSKTKKYILGVFGGIVGTVGITALITKTYKYFFDKNKNLKDNTDTVSTNV